MSDVIEDVLGTPVNVGDQIAGAFRIGNVAVLRVGTVLGFGERGNKLTVKVRWQVSSRDEGEITGSIESELYRFVKLNGSSLAPVEVTDTGAVETNEEIPAINP